MNGRGLLGTFAVVVLIAMIIGVGIGAYNAGVSEGLAEAARAAQAAGEGEAVVYPPYVGGHYGSGWGGGFGFFGVLLWILGFFLIIGLIRATFGWGRHGGGRGHGGWDGRRERMEEYHRELHRRDEPQGSSG